MPIVFSEHAKIQLKKRKISQKIIKHVVYTSKTIIPSYKTRKLREVKIRGKILRVVTRTEGSKITVITAYYLKDKNFNYYEN